VKGFEAENQVLLLEMGKKKYHGEVGGGGGGLFETPPGLPLKKWSAQ